LCKEFLITLKKCLWKKFKKILLILDKKWFRIFGGIHFEKAGEF